MQLHVVLLLGLAQIASGEQGSLRGISQKDFDQALLRELKETLGSSQHSKETEQKLHEFEDELRTTFKALPKNNKGALEGSYARYALHRFFAQRYGWQVKGLEEGSGGWYGNAGVGVMGDRMPPNMRKFFEARLESHGLLLRDLAALAVSIDSMFRSDVHDRLRVVYAAFELESAAELDYDEAIAVAQAYMATLIIGNPVERLDSADVMVSNSAFLMQQRYDQISALLTRTMHQVGGEDPQKFDWELMASWLLTFGKQLGHVENQECQSMKYQLLDREAGKDTGRVRLLDFHSADLNFEESLEELRSMEALDETDPAEPKVIIPNYLMGATNCVSPAGYYSICCLDECEELMDKIEGQFEAPTASPKAIASFVASLPSATVSANRSLAPGLLEKLEGLAMHNGGMVPLHSNKFAQWMHQAYPRECSEPRLADRFNQSLRYVMSEVKQEQASLMHGDVVISGGALEANSSENTVRTDGQAPQTDVNSIWYDVIGTVLMGMLGMGLAKQLIKYLMTGPRKAFKEF